MKKHNIAKLQKCISECCELPIDSINWEESLNLIDDLNFDSLSIISLVIIIEETFEMKIPEEKFNIENLCNYSKLKKLIAEQGDF